MDSLGREPQGNRAKKIQPQSGDRCGWDGFFCRPSGAQDKITGTDTWGSRPRLNICRPSGARVACKCREVSLAGGLTDNDPLRFPRRGFRTSRVTSFRAVADGEPGFSVVNPGRTLGASENVNRLHRAELLTVVINPINHDRLPKGSTAMEMPEFGHLLNCGPGECVRLWDMIRRVGFRNAAVDVMNRFPFKISSVFRRWYKLYSTVPAPVFLLWRRST